MIEFWTIVILTFAIFLNCLLMYLVRYYPGAAVEAFCAKQTPLKAQAIDFVCSIGFIGIWGGSLLYTTLGAVAVLDAALNVRPPFGDWKDGFAIANAFLSVATIGIANDRSRKKAKSLLTET